jgi:diguanylate cyclase (GGDEF)-like protein
MAPAERPVLIMLEPLRTAPFQQSAIVGVFEVKQLLEDFFSSGLPQRYPVQVLDGDTQLYRSSDWQPDHEGRDARIVVEHPVIVDAAHWTIQMQPGGTDVEQTLSWLNLLLMALSIVAGLGITIIVWILAARTWILQRAVAKRTAALRRATQRLRQMAVTDELTGLYNRRFFLSRWQWECERAKRYQRPLACLMIDINGFKQVNDRLGHPAGDLVLKQVAQELKALLRQSDILARFGGDEFVIALPETTDDQAALVAGKLRQISIRVPDGASRTVPPVSLSVGMSRIEQEDDSPQDILDAADRSLYASKRQRR